MDDLGTPSYAPRRHEHQHTHRPPRQGSLRDTPPGPTHIRTHTNTCSRPSSSDQGRRAKAQEGVTISELSVTRGSRRGLSLAPR